MYYEDHNPPHFHAKYGEYEAQINIETLGIIKGSLPPKALGLIVERATQHKPELQYNRSIVEQGGDFRQIQPLE